MPFGFFKKKNNNQNNTTNDKTLNTPEKNHDTTGQSKSIQGQRPHALNTSTVSSSLASSTSSSLSMAHYHHYYHPEMAQESSPPGVHAFSSSSFSKNSKSSHLPFNQRRKCFRVISISISISIIINNINIIIIVSLLLSKFEKKNELTLNKTFQ
eukprot:gb/GECH01008436.1/.p1 GENE.gb/GECH01008436.1/~~gb/GECH01008436.1/.p1  ORF type:complete len:154 (+),score=32.98 gb/GECH01008436.1/:1-462(+)